VQAFQLIRARRQFQIAAGEIRRLQPVCQREQFHRRENARRLAREGEFRRAGLRDFRVGVAERRADALQPLEGGGSGFKLLVRGHHQSELAQIQSCGIRSAVISQ
jgi:hypothetical protein